MKALQSRQARVKDGNSLSINMQSSGSGSEEGLFINSLFSAGANANVKNDLSLDIELTTTYMVQVSGSMALLFDPMAEQSGSQSFAFDDIFGNNDANQVFGGIAGQVLLAPGVYTLSADSSWSGEAVGGFRNPHEFDDRAFMSVNADFTPVVPEPRWIAVLLLPLAICVGLIPARHRT